MSIDTNAGPCGNREPNRGVDAFPFPPDVSDPDVHQAWLAAQACEWRSLALVPASQDLPLVELARSFAMLGLRHWRESIGVADLREVRLSQLGRAIEVIQLHVRRGERVVVVVGPCRENGATVPLVRAVDSAILCVALGSTRVAEAHEAVQRIGESFFLGTLLVRPTPPASRASLRSSRSLVAYT